MILVSIFSLLQGGGMLYIPCSSRKKKWSFWMRVWLLLVCVGGWMGKPDRAGKKSTNTFLLLLQFRLYFIALFDIKRNLNRNTFMLPFISDILQMEIVLRESFLCLWSTKYTGEGWIKYIWYVSIKWHHSLLFWLSRRFESIKL